MRSWTEFKNTLWGKSLSVAMAGMLVISPMNVRAQEDGSGDPTITRADTLAVTGTGYKGVYDGASHGVAASASVAEGTTVSYSVDGGAWTTEVPTVTNIGRHEVKVKAENANYEAAEGSYTLEVTPAPVTVTADDKSKVYGEDDPELTATVEGTFGTDTVAYTVTREDGEDSSDRYGRTYEITPSGERVQGNYTVEYRPGALTITKAPASELGLEVNTESLGKVYDGQALEPLVWVMVTEATTIEFKVGDGEWTTDRPSVTNVADSPLDFQVRATNPDYETAYAEGSLRITHSPLNVVANSKVKSYGEPDPTFDARVEGIIRGDYKIVYGFTRAKGESVEGGPYAITPVGDRAQGNYWINYFPGELTIVKANTLAVTGTDYEGVYDGASHGSAASVNVTEGTTVSYSVDGGAWTTEVPTVTNIGRHEVKVMAENPNYEAAEGSYTLEVTPAPVTVTARDASKVYGEDDPALTVEVTGLVGDDTVEYGVSREPGEDAKTYPIHVTGAEDQGNYKVAFVDGTFTITKATLDDNKDPAPAPAPTPKKLPKTDDPASLVSCGIAAAGLASVAMGLRRRRR